MQISTCKGFCFIVLILCLSAFNPYFSQLCNMKYHTKITFLKYQNKPLCKFSPESCHTHYKSLQCPFQA
nr:MAG TPA: hypothetical protein [Caudoviricetes sp.]